MGFDNESILNIQSLPGEYFCPVCRQLVYPNEALQTQCTHLYCKPCLTYCVSTTRACAYDGYLVTDTDSKPLQESNPSLAETIGRVAVHCLYHKSGCTWQGPLSESILHGNSCPYGSSPVVCNRCGTQIIHRQVQEHAQNCPGTQGQGQQPENAPPTQSAVVAAAYEQNPVAQAAGQQYPAQTPTQVAQAPVSQATNYGMGQDQHQGNLTMPQAAAQTSATDQWYQQQYQQYYQQYPQYDQYQQYQQYDQYQQQAQAQAQAQVQAQAQPQPQPHPQPQPQVLPQPQHHVQPQPQPQPQPQTQHQAQPQPQPQPQPQTQPQSMEVAMLAQGVHTPQPYQQVERQGHPGHQPQQVQPQQQIMPSQPHQLLPNQLQPVPIQQHAMPMQSQPQPVAQPHQHSLQMHQQFQSPQQQPQMHQQIPSSQLPPHVQQQPALLTQQLPHQQPHLQQQAQPHQHQQMMQQQPPQQQMMLQQQISPQLQQLAPAPVQQNHQQLPSQHQQLPHQSIQQPQQQQPFFPQPMQGQQFMQSQVQQAPQQHPQMQPTLQQGLQPPQNPPQQHYPQNAGQMNAPQQVGSRPPLTQNQGFVQQPFQQSPGRPFFPSHGQSLRASNKGSPATPNQGSAPNQTYMQRPGYRANLPHQQRLPLHQSAVPRPNSQQAVLSGSIPAQSSRTATQNAATSGATKLAPLSEKPPESTPAEKMSKTLSLQEKHGQQPTKDVQSNETNNVSGQKGIGETIKAEKVQPDNKSFPAKQELANEKLDQKNIPPTETGFITGPIKSEVSDSTQQQISSKDLHMQKQEGNSQQPTPQKKVVEDSSQKPSEGGSDKSLQGSADKILKEPVGQSLDANLEHTSLRPDGNSQQHPGQVQEGTFHKNVSHQVQEARRGADDKKQAVRNSQDTHQWQEGNAPQKSSQGQDRSLQQSLRQGPVQGQDRNLLHPSRQGQSQGQDRNLFQPSRQGPDQGQDKSILYPPRQGPVQGHDRNITPPRQGPLQAVDRNLLQPHRQGPSQVQSRNSQHPLYQGPVQGQERNMQQSLHPGSLQGLDRTLQQPLQQDRDLQQVPLQAQVQGYERFNQMPRQGQLQGQQLPYLGQPEGHDRTFQQLPYPGQAHDIPEQFQLSSSKQSGIPPMSSMPQLQPSVSSSMPSLARGHGQIPPQPKAFDLLSPAHLHAPNLGPRSSQGESMLGLPSSLSLPPSMPHHLSSFEGPRGFMERGLQFGQTLQQSTISKPMDHSDIMGNKRPEHFDNKQNDQHLTGPRFPMGHSSGFQPNTTKINGGTNKGHIEGMQAPSFPPIMGEEGGFQSMHQESSRQAADRKEFQENSRKYKPGQFDGQLPSNADELFPSARHQKSHPTPTSKFDQITPTSRPLEVGPHGLFPDANSKYPFSSAGFPTGGPSKLFPQYQSLGSFPSGSGGPSMFSSEIGDGSRLPGIHEDMMGRRPEAAGIRPDFMGSRMEFGRSRLDTLGPPRSPGKDYMGSSSGRANIGPTGGPIGGPTAAFGSGVGGPSFLSHPIEDFSRNPLGFDEQRNKSFGFHSSTVHNAFPPGQHPMGVGNRMPPFHSSGPAPGGPGPLPNHIMMGEPGANFGANVPMQGFPGEGGFHQMGQMPNDIEPMDLGRKRKPGSTGWCRICQIDCYTVEGLEQHSQTREHQKTAMDMVLSIKQDSAKKQKHSTEEPTSQENGNKAKRSGFEGRGTRR